MNFPRLPRLAGLAGLAGLVGLVGLVSLGLSACARTDTPQPIPPMGGSQGPFPLDGGFFLGDGGFGIPPHVVGLRPEAGAFFDGGVEGGALSFGITSCERAGDCRTAEAAFCFTRLNTCVACVADRECDHLGLPYCVDGGCVGCRDRGDCSSSSKGECFDGRCAECAVNRDCGAQEPVCVEGVCVQCVQDADCGEEQPHCSVGQCFECLDAGDCGGSDRYCNRGECHECQASSDCTDAARGRCVLGDCLPCVAGTAGACTGVEGKPVCDGSSGSCVECTAADVTACSSTVCAAHDDVAYGVSRHQCVPPVAIGDGAFCDLCVSDAECAGDAVCTQLDPGNGEPEWVCVPPASSGTCATELRPLLGLRQVTSADGLGLRVCLPLEATCPALRDAAAGTACLDADDHMACGAPDLADSVCAPRDDASGMFACASACTDDSGCTAGLSCGTAQYCVQTAETP